MQFFLFYVLFFVVVCTTARASATNETEVVELEKEGANNETKEEPKNEGKEEDCSKDVPLKCIEILESDSEDECKTAMSAYECLKNYGENCIEGDALKAFRQELQLTKDSIDYGCSIEDGDEADEVDYEDGDEDDAEDDEVDNEDEDDEVDNEDEDDEDDEHDYDEDDEDDEYDYDEDDDDDEYDYDEEDEEDDYDDDLDEDDYDDLFGDDEEYAWDSDEDDYDDEDDEDEEYDGDEDEGDNDDDDEDTDDHRLDIDMDDMNAKVEQRFMKDTVDCLERNKTYILQCFEDPELEFLISAVMNFDDETMEIKCSDMDRLMQCLVSRTLEACGKSESHFILRAISSKIPDRLLERCVEAIEMDHVEIGLH